MISMTVLLEVRKTHRDDQSERRRNRWNVAPLTRRRSDLPLVLVAVAALNAKLVRFRRSDCVRMGAAMLGGRTAWRTATIVSWLVWGVVMAGASHAQLADDAAALNAEAERLYQAGKYPETTEIVKRMLATRRRRWGATTPTSASCSTTWPGCTGSSVATAKQSRYTRATSRSSRRHLGQRTPVSATSLNGLAELYWAQGRYAEAKDALSPQPCYPTTGEAG